MTSHKENDILTERFSISENGRLIQILLGIQCLVKSTVNEGSFGSAHIYYSQCRDLSDSGTSLTLDLLCVSNSPYIS